MKLCIALKNPADMLNLPPGELKAGNWEIAMRLSETAKRLGIFKMPRKKNDAAESSDVTGPVPPLAAETADRPLVPAQCPKCGAAMHIDSQQDAAICTYCGSPFRVQNAIDNYSVNTDKTRIRIADAHFAPAQNQKLFAIMNDAFKRGMLKERERLKKEVSVVHKIIAKILLAILIAKFAKSFWPLLQTHFLNG